MKVESYVEAVLSRLKSVTPFPSRPNLSQSPPLHRWSAVHARCSS